MNHGGRRQAAPSFFGMAMLRALLLSLILSAGLLAQDTVIVLLRHAEKAHKGDTAELSEAGHRRAAGLPPQLAAYQPSALFASNLPRTQQTLAPLSKALGLPVQIYVRGEERALARRLLALHVGERVVVCGHSDTLGTLIEALGHLEPFPEVSGYDRFWVLRIRAGTASVTLEEHRQAPVGGHPPPPAPVRAR